MQRFFNSLLGLSLLVLVVFSTGCGEDDGGGTTVLPPAIFLASGDDVISFDSEIPVTQTSFSVSVDVSDGDALLQSLTITENGTTIPAANLEFDEGLTTAQNPFLIVGDDASGTIYDIEITPSGATPNTTSTYVFTVSDVDGMTASTELNITFSGDPATVTVAGVGINSGDDRSTAEASFQVDVTASAGTFDLSQIAVYENGVLLPAENVSSVDPLDGSLTALPSNPANVTDGLAFASTIQIDPVAPAAGLRTYTVEFSDTEGGLGSATFDVNFVEPMVDVLMGQLLNAAGPQGQGGLDLDDGNGAINSTSVLAEIKDEGIDQALPAETNWKQQISGANGATLVRIDANNQPDGFDFDQVVSYQEVIDAYNAGAPVSVTSALAGGEVFGVLRDGNYYLIRIAEVNVVVEPIGTPGGNDDNYVIDIINEAN
ncbi:hypothetical protein CEQ90_18125 [Lewinellaceae bacterium SD302]|nr:hypothetical protein CEQ90_18125 [Lewinellaceae bacterium SD302]